MTNSHERISSPSESTAPNVTSTGPRTEAGKAISSQNARKHDLCSRTLRLSPEEWAEYNDLCGRYRRDLQPAGEVEETLIDEICFNYWRLQQAREIELDAITGHPTDLRLISLYIRYRTGYERAFYKALDQIQKLQRDRRKRRSESDSAVRSAEPASLQIQAVTQQLERCASGDRVRFERPLDPLPPEPLAHGLDRFVSQNPDAVADRLLDILRKVA